MRALLYNHSGFLGQGVAPAASLATIGLNGWRVFPVGDEVSLTLTGLTTLGWVAGAADSGGVVEQALDTGLHAAHPGYPETAFDPVVSSDYIDAANSTQLLIPGAGNFDGAHIQGPGTFLSTAFALASTPTIVLPFLHVGVYTSVLTAEQPVELRWAPVTAGFTFSLSTNNGVNWQTASSGTALPIPPGEQGSDLIIRVVSASDNLWIQGWSVLF